MREFIQAVSLLEANIPETTYGYWITDVGDILVVANQQHLVVAQKHGFKTYEECYDAGWIRLVCKMSLYVIPSGKLNELSVRFADQKPSWKAMSALRSISRSGFVRFALDIEPRSSVEFISKTFEDYRPFYSLASQHRAKKEQVAEAAIPSADYGYWIKPDGEILPVSFEDHVIVLKMESGLHRYSDAYRAGWIRIVTDADFSFNFEEGKPTRRAISSLRRLAKLKDFRRYYVDISSDDKIIWKNFETVGPALLLASQHANQSVDNIEENKGPSE